MILYPEAFVTVTIPYILIKFALMLAHTQCNSLRSMSALGSI